MKRTHAPIANTRWVCVSMLALLFAGLPAAAAPPPNVVAEVENRGSKLVFYPVVEYERIILTVTGPCNFEERQVIRQGEVGVFYLSEETIDAVYTFQLVAIPEIDGSIIELLQQARKNDEYSEVNALCREGELPGPPITQAASFTVYQGEIVYDPETPEEGAVPKGSSALGGTAAGIPLKDFVINDDLIVDGSACIGFDCVNGESFGFDTVRLKENNLRIKFDDTSVAASYPRNDWQLTANDSANGGASKFSIDDISGNRTPFTVEANARSHSLYVDDGGRIGSRTSTPSTEIHTIDGDTPTLRLQQDGSSGFAPQTWDVAGNETNFFIRDVTNGSQLPFRIRPDAPTSSIFIDTDGDIGLGTSSPDASLHVRRTDETAMIHIEEASGTTAERTLLDLENNGRTEIHMTNSDSGNEWEFGTSSSFFISRVGSGGTEVDISASGNLTLRGGLRVCTSGSGMGGAACAQTDYPDYVFEDDYPLMPLGEVAEFIEQEGHLPNVISLDEVRESGSIDMTRLQLQLLEKVEELTLYTLDQQKTIDELSARLEALTGQE